MDKMVNTAKRLDIAARILFWICLVGAFLLTFRLIAPLFLPWGFNPLFTNSGVSNLMNFYVADGDYVSVFMVRYLGSTILQVFLAFFACYCIASIRKILKPMKEGRPFGERLCKSLRHLSWATLIVGTVLEGINLTIALLQLDQAIFASHLMSSIHTIHFEYRPNYLFLVLFIILYLMSYIFQYGQQLQQLEDETL